MIKINEDAYKDLNAPLKETNLVTTEYKRICIEKIPQKWFDAARSSGLTFNQYVRVALRKSLKNDGLIE